MLSEQQYLEKLEKVKTVVEAFLRDKKTIQEISKETGISSSSVQRYLNDEPYIKEIYKRDAEEIIVEIKRRLSENYYEGKKLGGDTFAQNNIATKDEEGHFTGSIRRQ